jgi:hypothetical protein
MQDALLAAYAESLVNDPGAGTFIYMAGSGWTVANALRINALLTGLRDGIK